MATGLEQYSMISLRVQTGGINEVMKKKIRNEKLYRTGGLKVGFIQVPWVI